MHKHTFALVSNFSLTVGVQEILRTVSPPSGMIPCDGIILIIDKRLWSQIYNQKFAEMWHYPLKLSFQNFHRLLLHHYTERWPAGTGHDMMWNRFSNSRQTFRISTRICTPNPQTELSAGTSSNPNRIMKWLWDFEKLTKEWDISVGEMPKF